MVTVDCIEEYSVVVCCCSLDAKLQAKLCMEGLAPFIDIITDNHVQNAVDI